MKNQVEKFEAKYGKVKGDEVAEAKKVEQKIATQIEEKKQELNAIAVLTHSVQILSKQVEGLLKERVIDAITMDGIGDMLNTLIVRQANTMTETDVRINTMMESHRNRLLVTDEELHELGIGHYVNYLHQYRADQIKITGSYTDPVDLTTLPVQAVTEASVIKAKEWLASPIKDIMPDDPKPFHIELAMEIMHQYCTKAGSYRWRQGGKELIFAMLTYLEWKGINITKTTELQAHKLGRCVIQNSMFNKDKYGILKWSDIISQYNTREEVR
jgi:hypothetical protein